MRGNDYMYAVVECDTELRVRCDVSHWVYRFIMEANQMRDKMQAANPELTFVVLHLNKR